MENLMTCQAVADRLSVDLETVWRWIRSGMLQAYKVGRFYRISQEQLDAFVKEQSK